VFSLSHFSTDRVTAVVAGCAAIAVDADRDAQAHKAFVALSEGRFGELIGDLPDRSKGLEELTTIRQLLPDAGGKVPVGEARTWSHVNAMDREHYTVARDYLYPNHAARWVTQMSKGQNGRWAINGMHLQVANEADLARAAFTLSNKGPAHLTVLSLAVLSASICLVTSAIAAWRRQWLWMIASLFGIGTFVLNWTTGQWIIKPVSFMLLGAGFSKSGSILDPWMISVSLPLGAIAYWFTRKRQQPPSALQA
jgi:hypothetical protein